MTKKKDLLNSNSKEIVAHIHNKLQPAKTLIGMCMEGKAVPKKFISKAKKDLDEVVKLLNSLEKIKFNVSGQADPKIDKATRAYVKEACKKRFEK